MDDTLDGDDRRVLRGGAFYDAQNVVRCAYRHRLAIRTTGTTTCGFRMCAPGL